MGNMLTAEQIFDEASIASRGFKAVLHRGAGGTRSKRDKEGEAIIHQAKGDDSTRAYKKIFHKPGSLIFLRANLSSEMYQYHMKHTRAHEDDGARVLPAALLLEYQPKMDDFKQRIDMMDRQILATYDQIVADDVAYRNMALMSQGKPATVTADDYPTRDQLANQLYVQWYIEPIPTAGDFRYEVDQSIKDRLNERLRALEAQGDLDLLTRMLEPMKRFVEKLSVPIGTDGGIFRDSLITNLNELVQHLPKLNITGNPEVQTMIDGIESIIKPYVFNPDALREQPIARQSARDKMAELMKRLDGYNLGA